MRGLHNVKTWGKAQPMVTLSTAEAELVAGIKAATEGRGFGNLLNDFGTEGQVKLMMDATAAIGILERRGLGATKHIDTRWMWLQGAIRRGDIMLLKVHTKQNPADLMTKLLTAEDTEKHLNAMGYFYKDKLEAKKY